MCVLNLDQVSSVLLSTQIGVGTCLLNLRGAMVPEMKSHFYLVHAPIKRFFLTFRCFWKVFKYILMEAQLQNDSLASHEPCPLFRLSFSPFTIMFSSYSHGLSLEMYLEIFNPLSQIWAYNVFITFGFFFLHFIIIFFLK